MPALKGTVLPQQLLSFVLHLLIFVWFFGTVRCRTEAGRGGGAELLAELKASLQQLRQAAVEPVPVPEGTAASPCSSH